MKEGYLAWLPKAKQAIPNQPSVVYKYWFLIYQKTTSPDDQDRLLGAFIEKRKAIETLSHSSLQRILSMITIDNRIDEEFVRLLYFHFILLSVFSEEKVRLETESIESIEHRNALLDMETLEMYLNQPSFDIAFRDLFPEKLKHLSDLSRKDSIDINIVNFFDEDACSGIQLEDLVQESQETVPE